MEALNTIIPDFGVAFLFGFGLSLGSGFLAGGIAGTVNYIRNLMGG